MNGALEVSFTPARLNIKAQKEALNVDDHDDGHDDDDGDDDDGYNDDDGDGLARVVRARACAIRVCLERATIAVELNAGNGIFLPFTALSLSLSPPVALTKKERESDARRFDIVS